MVADHLYTRTDSLEIRDIIFRKIGEQRAEKYFDQLRKLFSLQLNKIEFDKLCIRTIGRENIHLHNRFIKCLIKNACLAKVPPPKVRKVERCFSSKVSDSYRRSCLQSLSSEALPKSPRKARSPVNRDHKYLANRNAVGKSPNTTGEEVVQRVQQQQSATELHSLGSRPPVEAASVEDGEEVEQFAGSPSIQSRSLVTAPLGVSMKTVGPRKAISSGLGAACSIRLETCQNSGHLPDTRYLRSRLENKLRFEGVGVSVDCANLLNNGLDAFLRRLIEPCIALAGARCGGEHIRHVNGQSIPESITHQIEPGLNGMLNGGIPTKRQRTVCGSMLDFQVALESNPCLLGEDWPIQFENICTRAMAEWPISN